MKEIDKFLLFSHPDKPGAHEAALNTEKWLLDLGADVALNGKMPDAQGAVSFGGDGFVLHVANNLPRDRIVPLARVNFGRFGFLTNIEPNNDDIRMKIGMMMRGEYIVTARTRLEANYTNERFLPKKGITFGGLNDIYVERDGAKTIKLLVEFGNISTLVWGDGVLLATRTGSTGYNRSLGGPIITNENQVVLKLMGTNAENHTAYVCPAEGECTIKVAPGNAACLVVDGHKRVNVADGSVIKIGVAPTKNFFVEFGDVPL